MESHQTIKKGHSYIDSQIPIILKIMEIITTKITPFNKIHANILTKHKQLATNKYMKAINGKSFLQLV